ncbi:MAG: HAMP domain-containing histidine kinase [Candidatus Peribacteraceae bacterium]|nr:HAMP domain-containing histidine kinase [Candidatus Peribacteraceae bacterium]
MKFEKIKKILQELTTYIPLVVTAVIAVFIILIIYNQTQQILKERLREKLIAIASTAALQVPAEDIKIMQKENSLTIPQISHVISIMKKIRDSNTNLKYIYIWSPNNKNTVSFTADAEMIEPVDRDGNGKIDGPEIPPKPGEDYDVTDLPAVKEAFFYPTAQNDFIVDKWGTFLSGFAPIKDDSGQVVAILGMDVEVSDYYKIITATFIPFLLLTILLLLLLTVQTVSLSRIWKSRVNIVKEIDRQKDELLGIVSHQLATPITSIKWQLEMMLEGDIGKISKQQEDYLKSMQSVIRDLNDLVALILDVSRIELNRVKIAKQDLNLATLFTEIFKIISPKAKEKDINLIWDVPNDLPIGKLDRRYTKMTLENILSNAVKYSAPKKNVELHVTIENNKLKCIITDSGCGIPKQDQKNIFGKLYRASNVINSVDGNGFGLYIAKGAVENQGGSIHFESEEGRGTSFFIELPLDQI